MASWERLGPIRYRFTQFAIGVSFLVAALLLVLTFETVRSFYQGTGVVKSTPEDKPVIAQAIECKQVGPVSGHGFGFWWVCGASVRAPDGRVTETVVGRSKLTPDDIGQEVDFREACFDEERTDCAYGRPVLRIWSVALSLVNILVKSTLVFLLIGAAICLLTAVIGAPRYFALVDRFSSRR